MDAADRPHFGALLRQFRRESGITQQELAERAKLSVEAISLLERGARTRPHRDTVVLLGRALMLSPEREALLASAIGIARPPITRERGTAPNALLLRLVPSDGEVPRHNLPRQLTSFVGRQREVGEITTLLHDRRLVTIVGAGGVGKTRAAVQLGSDLLDDFPDGVWLVDLDPLSDPARVASVVLTALQLPSTADSALDVLVAYLKKRRTLLMLDNCEQVITQAGGVAASVIQLCPHVRILSTSRAPLEVSGERVYRLPSLAVPPYPCRTARESESYGAVALFVDRAVAVDASFVLTDDNAPDVAEICRRLDGIPLAIELAAARVKVLAPRQIAQRLDQRFRLLTAGDPKALPRHQTMTALIDWSYDLLTPREQRFFESLSIFAGGCTLDTVTAVCAADDEDEIDAVDLIGALVTKSLLVAELAGSEQRYRLLESSRQYSRDKLIALGGREQVARRHALAYAELAERLDRSWETEPDRTWLPRAQVEVENWRAAFDWALGKRGDVTLGQRLAVSRRVVWLGLGLDEGRRWVRRALDSVDGLTPPLMVAKLEHAEAEGARLFGERKVSLDGAERALMRYRELGDMPGIAQAQYLVGDALVFLRRPADSERLLREAVELARKVGNRRLVASALESIGFARSAVGDFAAARAYFTEALRLAKLVGADLHAASLALSLAICESEAGDSEAALRLTADLLASRPPSSKHVATALVNMAEYLITLGRYDEARVHANEALELALTLRMSVLIALSLQHLALVALLRPQIEGRRSLAEYAVAARLCGFVDAQRTALGISVSAAQQEHDRTVAVLRDTIGPDDLVHLLAAGATMTEDEAVDLAHAIP